MEHLSITASVRQEKETKLLQFFNQSSLVDDCRNTPLHPLLLLVKHIAAFENIKYMI